MRVPTMAQVREQIREKKNPRCKHEHTTLMFVSCSNGKKQVRHICTSCHWKVGDAVKRPDDVSKIQDWVPPPSDEKIKEEIEAETNRVWWEIYNQYLLSDDWAATRSYILRVQPICQLCGAVPSEVVHHLSYANVGEEKLGELVGLCRPCHQRLHPYKKLA